VICTVDIIEESGFGGTSSTRGAKIKKIYIRYVHSFSRSI
jgi:hypothetical protein